MIAVKNLNKTFISQKSSPGLFGFMKPKIEKKFEAVKDLTFSIQPGEFVALLGANGAGKTTTLKMLTGIIQPTSGGMTVAGFEPTKRQNEFKKAISFVMAQKSQLFLELPVKDTFEFISEVYCVQNSKLLDELIERFNIGDKIDTHARRLSLGQRMKCELICSFLYQPKVIFLDEPTIGLDVNSVSEVRAFLKETNHILGTTIILTTHNMDDVEELCERTIMLNNGTKIFDGNTKELKNIFGDERIIEFIIDSSVNLSHSTPPIIVEKIEGQKIYVKTTKKDSAAAINEVMNHYQVNEINFKETNLSEVVGKLYVQ